MQHSPSPLTCDQPSTSYQTDGPVELEEEPTSENLRRILDQVQSTMQMRDTAPPFEENHTSSGATSPNPDAILAGRILGPHRVKHYEEANDATITVDDGSGKQLHLEILSDDPVLHDLKSTTILAEANALLYVHENILWLMTVRPISPGQPITGLLIKSGKDKEELGGEDEGSNAGPSTYGSHPCEDCGVSFKSQENLTAHRLHYCKARLTNANRPLNGIGNGPQQLGRIPLTIPLPGGLHVPLSSASTSVPPLPTNRPFFLGYPPKLANLNAAPPSNIIFLPVAFLDTEDENAVQLCGPPQTIIPVAVGRGSLPDTLSAYGMPRILVNSDLNSSETNFSTGDINLSIPLVQLDRSTDAELRKRRAAGLASKVDMMMQKRSRPGLNPAPIPTTVSASLPIPLPIKIPKITLENGEKPFLCACGVSFSAEATLNAHQQHYCKLSARQNDGPGSSSRDSPRKVPSRCSQCDYQPNSASQLSVHMRQAHADVQAYVCRECGYRGFSPRGIRAHMRTHTNLEDVNAYFAITSQLGVGSASFEDLLNNHVIKVSHNGRTASTSSDVSEQANTMPDNPIKTEPFARSLNLSQF